MIRVVWACWLQGRENAPRLVRRCLDSWETRNPGWQVRCLDASSLRRYVDVPNLHGKAITAASFSDMLRILLLREYGGVWADATLFCNRPLDEWLGPYLAQGFFAFDKPGPDRPLSSWFLAARENDSIVARWHAKTLDYWSERCRSDDYFWFHHLFGELCDTDSGFAEAWRRVPKLSAVGPHAVQENGLFSPLRVGDPPIDWGLPVFKLTHRYREASYRPGTLVWDLLENGVSKRDLTEPVLRRARAFARTTLRRVIAAHDAGRRVVSERFGSVGAAALSRAENWTTGRITPHIPEHLRGAWWRSRTPRSFAALRVSTQNLGDHVQVHAGLRLLERAGIEPTRFVDRDDGLASAASLNRAPAPVGLLLNGWFKNNPGSWPPHENIAPVFLGFHIRSFQCPDLVSDAALAYYRRHGPIGCRDRYTRDLLAQAGVECFASNCLSLTLPRRVVRPAAQTEVLVASRDERLCALVPDSLGPRTYVNHYVESRDFEANMARAIELLETYAARARLIVTSFLHCALPAIAMGIPVVVFYPQNTERGHASDRERFSSLVELTRVYRFDEVDSVEWSPRPVEVAETKLALIDRFETLIGRWSPSVPQSGGRSRYRASRGRLGAVLITNEEHRA